MKIKYNLLILLGIIILLSISSVNAAPIEEHNLTPSNQKIITSEHSKVHENTIHNNSYIKYNHIKNKSKIENIANKNESKIESNVNKNKILLSSNEANTYSYNGILSGANRTTNFINNNHRLPAVVGIDGKNVNMNDFLYLLCKSLNNTSSTTLTNYSHVSSTTGTNCDNVKIYKNDYLTLSNEIIKCYNVNKRNPKDISLYSNTISYDDTVYFYARAVAWKYNHNGQLPNYGTVIALYNNDYSTEKDALIINTTIPFTINSTTKQLSNGKYNLTLKSSENCTIYYTTDGTTPTNNSTKYTNTLTIYNNTLVKYYGINKNKQKTPILTYGIYQPSTPYITNKPQLEQNGYENKVNIATSQKST
ncbi:MAG: chitobiase/beta-hexosaminidase C-terminal domain-containing protein, partial [Methanosphaera sp.]